MSPKCPGGGVRGDRPEPGYTTAALAALAEAHQAEHDFAGWLAVILARLAAQLRSSGAVSAGRPGSWEAALVDQLVKGTVGYDDEYLAAYALQEGS